jgi:hypothetical protein
MKRDTFAHAARAIVPRPLRPAVRRAAARVGVTTQPGPFAFQYPFWETMAAETSSRPQYQWGTLCAAALAKALGHDRVSVVELGVAGGNGLIELERVAADASAASGVVVEVHGFDSGVGLPKPTDYRDLPQMWDEGAYGMDEAALRRRLTTAHLHIGPVAETVPAFVAGGPAPIGFISFDLDLYSSTRDAMALFDADTSAVLPRVVCYFDDIIGFSHSDFAGERLAIAEYNADHEARKISKIYGLRYILDIDRWWTEMMYMWHDFGHPRYCEFDGTNVLREIPLQDG